MTLIKGYYYIDTDEIPVFFLLLKNYICIARSEDTIFYLSRVRILVSPWLLTLLANYCLYFSFITLYPSFITSL